MFDDPKKRLQELELALKEAESREEEPDWLQDAKDFLNELDGVQEKSAPKKAEKRVPESVDLPRTKYADEEMSEDDALYVVKPQRKGALPLVILALLELIAMMLIVLWWMKWTL